MKKYKRLEMLYGFLFYAVSVFSRSANETAEEILQIKATCSLKNLTHSCADAILAKTCNCDNMCLVYDDCCVDSPLRRYRSIRDHSPDQWKCEEMGELGFNLVKTRCPEEWSENPDVRGHCEGIANRSLDPFKMMPASDPGSKVTYKNIYCAVCHGKELDKLSVWSPIIKVLGLSKEHAKRYNVDVEYLKRNIKFDRFDWMVSVPGGDGSETIYDVKIEAKPPAWYRKRGCAPDLVTRCPEAWRNSSLAKKCLAYQAVTYSSRTKQGYRNLNCARCHGVPHRDLICRAPPKPSLSIERRTLDSFGVLLDYSGGGQVGTSECEPGSKYDPFHKCCKKIVCGFPWLVVKDNKCVRA